MNNFLGTLIGRHQGSHETLPGFKVQPRPKSRFETESLARTHLENHFDQDESEIKTESGSLFTHSLLNNPKDENTEITQVQPQTQDTSISLERQPIFVDHTDEMDEPFKILSEQLGSEQPAQEHLLPLVDLSTQQVSQPFDLMNQEKQTASIDRHIITSHHSEKISSDSLPVQGLNQRIQEILQRLQNKPSVQTQEQIGLPLHKEIPVTHSSPENSREPVQNINQLDVKQVEIGHSIAEPLQVTNKSNTPTVQQAGVLQIPTWLTEMQTDLNNRFQALHAKTEVDPVVNVTIGRVEVKAIQTETTKQSKTRKKPSGVMSLDDYLKQKESRGRA